MKKQKVTSTQAWNLGPQFLSLVKRSLYYTTAPETHTGTPSHCTVGALALGRDS